MLLAVIVTGDICLALILEIDPIAAVEVTPEMPLLKLETGVPVSKVEVTPSAVTEEDLLIEPIVLVAIDPVIPLSILL